MKFKCKLCSVVREGSEPITCGHGASQYELAEKRIAPPEEVFVPIPDLEGVEDKEGFVKLFGDEK